MVFQSATCIWKKCIIDKGQWFLFHKSLIRKEATWIIQLQIKKTPPMIFLVSLLPFSWSSPGIQDEVSFPFWSMEKISSYIMVVFLCSFILLTFILKAFRTNWEHFKTFFHTKVMEAAALVETNPFPSEGELFIMQLCLSSYKIRNIAAALSATLNCSEPFMLCHYNTYHYLLDEESISLLSW